MKIKTIFSLLGLVIFVASTLFIWLIFDLARESKKLKTIEHNRYLMFEKSDQLRRSSNDLTRFARTYAITENVDYKEAYFSILDIRKGLIGKPDNYPLAYWHGPDLIKDFGGSFKEPISLLSEMQKLPYLTYELDRLREAESRSDDLVLVEIEAFNAMEGLFKDTNGNYSIIGKTNQSLATDLLYSVQYQHAKEQIMFPINEFLQSLSHRTVVSGTSQILVITDIFNRIFLLILLGVFICILSVIFIRKKILSPIDYLTKTITSFKNGDNDIKRKVYFEDEIGSMINVFFEMKSAMDQDLKRLEFALSAGRQGWYELNPETGKFTVSSEYAELIGFSLKEIGSDTQQWKKSIHPSDRNKVFEAIQKCTKNNTPIKMEYRRKHKNGSWIWLQTVGESMEWDSDGKVLKIIGVHTDITENKQISFREDLRNNVMELLVKTVPLTDILESILAKIEQDNSNIKCSILLVDKKNERLFTGDSPLLRDFYEDVKQTEISAGISRCGITDLTEKRVIIENIQTHPLWTICKEFAATAALSSYWSEPIFENSDKVIGTFSIYHDNPTKPIANDLKLMEFVSQLVSIVFDRSKIREQMLLSARVFSHTHEGIVITDPQGIIVDINPAFCVITGYTRKEVIGKNPHFLSSGKHPPQFFYDMWQSINQNSYWQGEVWNRKKNGELYAELLSISAIKNNTGKTFHYVGLFSDITHNKKQQEKLNLMAHYDELTRLPNRNLFNDRFHQAIAHSQRTKTQLAICFLDLDNFKPVNDLFGHEIGDRLLVEVAQRITECIRQEDTISRQGGDEFALLLGDLESYEECEKTLQRIQNSLVKPFVIDSYAHKITASCGITLYPKDKGDIDTLLRHADQAMYQAKLAGKHRYSLYNAEHDQQTMHKHTKLEEIQQGLVNNEFELYYQPKVNMKTGDVFGVEALIRWNHPIKGLLPPLDFLPVMESTDLEITFGNWIVGQALAQLTEWKRQNFKLEVSVNISSHHLLSSFFVEQLKKTLSEFPNIEASDLQLEILESSVLSDLGAIGEIINICRNNLGVNIALDDFGTGYSSLTHLRNLSANTIKIDQTFVRDMLEDPSDYAIIDSVIGLANSFERRVIAEGVETSEHGLMLLLMGCEDAQGYGIAKPMPAKNIPQWLSNYKPNKLWLTSGNKKYTQQQTKIAIFRLATSQWKKHFVANIQLAPKNIINWPITDSNKCPCGTWIRREKQEQIFDEKWLKNLSQLHNNVHTIADNIIKEYESDSIENARQNLSLLELAFDDMNNQLKNFK